MMMHDGRDAEWECRVFSVPRENGRCLTPAGALASGNFVVGGRDRHNAIVFHSCTECSEEDGSR